MSEYILEVVDNRPTVELIDDRPELEVSAPGPAGPQGATGAGITVLGTLNDVSELPLTGEPGDAYFIGQDLYVRDIDGHWTNTGSVKGADGPQGPQGEPGPEGPQGPEGPMGPEGPQGIQGPQGLTGPKGDTGNQGIQGPIGLTGAAGPKGDQGIQGPKGDTGNTGPAGSPGPANTLVIGTTTTVPPGSNATASITGTSPNQVLNLGLPKGSKGDTGPQGIQGPQGPQGADSTVPGPQGPQGLTGPKGDTGDQGPQGIQGVQGPKGDQGDPGADSTVPGPQGEQGPQGPAGTDGDDAYEVAVSQGFSGTRSEWLASLVGPEGPQGDTGPAGSNGVSVVNAAFNSTGNLTTFVSTQRSYVARNGNLVTSRASLATAGSTASTILIKKNGTTVHTDTIASGTNVITNNTVVPVVAGDYFTIECSAAGTGAKDLVVALRVEES